MQQSGVRGSPQRPLIHGSARQPISMDGLRSSVISAQDKREWKKRTSDETDQRIVINKTGGRALKPSSLVDGRYREWRLTRI